MLILDHDVLEVIIGSFMDHLRPAINGMFEFLSLAENKRITFAFTLSFFFLLLSKDVWDGNTCTREGEGGGGPQEQVPLWGYV